MTMPGLELTSTLQAIAARGPDPSWLAVNETLGLIRQREPAVNAWVHVGEAQALRQAMPSPQAAAPLAGVPFAVKDVIDVAGMPTRCGSAAEPDVARSFDASCVSVLRMAGAVPVGKTVTTEYAFRHPGPTQNPRAPGHTPGGSSSGSAAAVADGMVPFALGTQTGGSIIRPAAYCGVVGFKPSFGGVFRDGLRMTCESLDVIGWHTRSVIDAGLLARVLLPYPAPAADASVRPRKVAIVQGDPDQGIEAPARRALQRASVALERQGIVCIDVPFVQGAEVAEIHGTIMHYEFARSLLPVVQRHPDRLSAALLETVRKGLQVPDETYLEKRHAQMRLRAAWRTLFGDADVILTPSAPGTAPRGLSGTGTSSFNRIWSALGWPCLHLPTGVGEDGLPIGVQLVGPYESDRQLLSWAAVLHGDLLAMQGGL